MAVLARNWWAVALRGIAAIVFGVLAFAWPGPTVAVLVLLFGAFALVHGAFALAAPFAAGRWDSRWWPLLVQGVLGIAVGLITAVLPGATALGLLFAIGVWSIAIGITEIVAAISMRREIENEWTMALGGVLAILFGLYVLVFPGAGALALVWLIGSFAIIWGLFSVALAWRLRGLQGRLGPGYVSGA
jgi:uncharacterized membrane protein HdeD (DUF308 family)